MSNYRWRGRAAWRMNPPPSVACFQVTSEDIRNMASVFTEKEQEGVVNSAVVMGFLIRFM